MLEIRLLGQFDLRRDGQTLALPSRPAQTLLAYLVLNPGINYRREQLAGLLAPEADEAAARNTLRHALWRVRKSLGGDPRTGRDYITADDITLGFDAQVPYWLDAAVVAARLPPDASTAAIGRVLALYGGDLLPGFYEDWVVLERERLEAAFEGKMRLYLDRQTAAGCWDDVLEWGERWISLGKSPESAYCALMLAHAARADSSRVASVYRRCVEDLAGNLGVEPSESTRSLHESLMRGEGPLLPAPEPRQAAAYRMAGGGATPSPGPPPYKGLQAFEVYDAPLFFGRETLTADLVEHLRHHDLLVLVGASGSGKSSLLAAGLIPALRRGELLAGSGRALQNTADWTYTLVTPTGRPLNALAAAVAGDLSLEAAGRLADAMAADPRSLALHLARRGPLPPVAGPDDDPRHQLLVVDQLEELFTLCPREEERSAFIANLMAAVSPVKGRCGGSLTLVLALRADFYGHCAAYAELRRALESCQHYIGPMGSAELRRCIEGPLTAGDWRIEPGLADVIVRDAGGEPGALPLVSHALLETWRGRTGRLLTLEGYTAAGGVRGAVARTADTVFAQFDAEEQAIARRIFLRLTALGDGMAETRRRVAESELLTSVAGQPLIESVLYTLAAARLITLGDGQVEVAHEALIREWPLLRGWLAEDREGLRLHRRLGEAAETWTAADCDGAYLYRGAPLLQIVDWAGRHDGELSLLEAEFLSASQAEAHREHAERAAAQQRELEAARQLAATETSRADEQRASYRELRRRAWLLAAALVFALAMTSLAMVMWRQAGASAQAAVRQEALAFSRELAASAEASLGVDPQRAILLGLEAVEAARTAGLNPPVEAEAALHHAVQSSPLDAAIPLGGTALASADGPLAVSYAGSALEAWNLTALRGGAGLGALPRYTLTGGTGVFDLTRRGDVLAVATEAGEIVMYDAATGEPRRVLPGHGASVTALRLSDDGSRLVSTGADATVRTWDTVTGEEFAALSRPVATPRLLDISPDGTRILATPLDGGVYLWDPQAGQRLAYVIGHAGQPWAVAFCGRPDRFVVGSGLSVRLWDAESGLALLDLSVGEPSPTALACNGFRLAVAAGSDVQVWDLETGEPGLALPAGSGIRRLSFTADNARLVTAGQDGQIEFWDLEGSREFVTLGTVGGSSDVAFSPDGSLLTAGVGDAAGAFAAWRAPGAGQRLAGREEGGWPIALKVRGHGNIVSRLAFDPRGGRLATSGLDETVRLWDLPGAEAWPAGGEVLATLPAEVLKARTGALSAAFAPRGDRLAVAAGSMVWLWDVAAAPAVEERVLAYLPPPREPLALAWSPDGSQLAIGLSDGTIHIAEPARSGGPEGDGDPVRVTGHAGAVLDVAFNGDGSLLASVSADGTARVWRVEPGRAGAAAEASAMYVLRGHAGDVTALAFGPGGKSLVTGGEDGAVEFWDPYTGRSLGVLATLPAPVTGIAFSPDARFLATSGDAVRVFVMRLDDLVALARTRVTRELTPEECRQWLHEEAGACGP